ncbi:MULTISPECIES: LysR family transcriptional regulator [unclassified Undibacterium]|uniref:LysR family transcriptional regulator n=1 Tax=unclassified Undibacterium TaxID=2630295 RepID=UPI002AC8E561|nr:MULTISPECIES: LysR family transcriptional regulator [unclassified Undibacterium]MEB0140185.1 LysR family transcriptional regulator [Undibacterium sp. CCC2.1]MEB0172441.1 LysR family transcriptional regulator [Undibacterium sp. CCC1.1]MEB0176959.1 LysR family transcriptional regulator [Undibacterium sp. CCC3.4]MEB0215563.1 LysR family transcriptional regulator [Undibacterium sp. 5I2]WPX43730.1 LysR family transcriptional regulator [Undibacterium sp. CCC3.4]
MDRLTAMQVFTEVAQSGSFSATADKLDMSRAMVTRYVGELERWLDARLLQRTTRSVTLTDAGENCLRRSQQMLALMQHVEEETCSRDAALRGQLRITCSVSLAYAQIAAAIVEFLQLYPQLKIDLNASEGALSLVEARIDLAIRISATPDPNLIGRLLAPCTSVLVAAPAYLAQHGHPAMPADLPAHRCLCYANFGQSVWKLQRGEEQMEVAVASNFSANEATALLRAALAGGGIALQPTYLANPHLLDGSLQVVLPDWNLPDMGIYALYPSRKHLSPAVRALLDFLVQRFATAAW